MTLIESYDDQSYFGKKGEKKTFDVPAFTVAKYPVTNAQYRVFVDAQGYNIERWWTPAGWQFRQKESWAKPRFWDDAAREPFNRPDHPVVGMSWYEALAFCMWLSETWSEKILLPTEQMWQRAAQGDDGRAYPWGKNWDGARCKNAVKPNGRDHTAPVIQYAGRDKGDSPFGVSDMAGNVWEWCLTDYDTGSQDVNESSNRRVLRGGSWYYFYPENFRVDGRYGDSPVDWDFGRGFRIARF
ncbi:MAG: SUMF1/EgtB/PvdO family nonheme iron enzyme [Chloroflexi bacterium]|nr:SUMF1/EgtB/PvdO family nonheme iron enzyme [Chloroflexota bacterium]